MHQPKWGVFFDFHTQTTCPDVGRKFDFDAITDGMKACGVDYIIFPARCNIGTAYYDTKIGTRHPSLTYDLLGKLVESCQRKGIAISAYINVGLSHEEGLLHRDWLTISPEGYTYLPNIQNNPCFFRRMCYNSPYAAHVTAMAEEVVRNYPVAGMFFDCMGIWECVGVECVREMKRTGYDWSSSADRLKFAHLSQIRMAKRISDALRGWRNDLLLYFNGVAFEDQKDIGTYLEYECLPTGGWGYDSLPVYARYARNLGKPILNMTGRFHESWADFGGIRTEASLEFDCVNGLANCMRTTIGDHFHPRGDINKPVFSLYKKVYGKLQKLDPWIEGATPLTDLALIARQDTFNTSVTASAKGQLAVQGATRMLCELKAQFDVFSTETEQGFDRYKAVVLCDHVQLDGAIGDKVKARLAAGGKVLSTAWSGLDAAGQEFALPEFWRVSFKGESPYEPAFINVKPGFAAGFPEMPVALYDKGTEVEALKGVEIAAEIVAPYFTSRWDGEHYLFYNPPDKATGKPALTLAPSVAHFTHPIFSIYHNHAPIPMRQLLAAVLSRLLPDPLLKSEGLPSFARATVTEQKQLGRRMVHFMAYAAERRGAKIDMIEEPIELRDVNVSLRTDGVKYRRAYLAPSMEEVRLTMGGGYASATVPVVNGHALLIFQE